MKARPLRASRAAGAGPSVSSAHRRGLLAGAGLTTLGLATGWLGVGSAGAGDAAAAPWRVDVDLRQQGAAVNRRLLGHNVQWVDRGDDLLREDGSLDPAMLAQVRALGPTVLRFPGGAQSDVYHWQRGVGAPARRGLNEHVHARRLQPSVMGTAEFLALCAATGAEPLITVNVPSGTPEEAAGWVHATNVAGLRGPGGARLPGVRWWEIGNEPYLKEERPDLALEPEAYARRVDVFVRAMRAVDASIQVGLPVSNAQRNGVPVVHYPRWLDRVLATLSERIDFAAVHDAYLPFVQEVLGDAATQRELAYWAAMAGARAVQQDLQALAARLAQWRAGAPLPLAITEYHALFSLGQGARDDWTGSPAGALYVADLLRMAATQPGLLMANLWSLSGNGRFGAIHAQGFARPVGQVLALMSTLLQGRLAGTAVACASVATPRAGLVPAQAALPLVEALATLDSAPGRPPRLRVLLLHKHPRRAAQGQLQVAGAGVRGGAWRQLAAPEPLRADDVPGLFTSRQGTLGAAAPLALTLPPASLTLLELDLDGRPGAVPAGAAVACAGRCVSTASFPPP